MVFRYIVKMRQRPRDLTRLGIALCGDGTVDGVRVLSEDAIAMMRQEQSEATTGITSDTPYTFFTVRQDTLLDGRRVYGHQGTDEGIVCNLYVEPVSRDDERLQDHAGGWHYAHHQKALRGGS